MNPLIFGLISAILLSLVVIPESKADFQRKITGRSEEEVKKNAFLDEMDYPVGPMQCSQRCSQWWEKQSKTDEN